ncbi:hypothetical protein [Microvirga mediterraneensis]|uniref:Flagellar assembly protein FliH/Type III secretion system HrpE domain-containing protein n=1 Tax=Microvirga mediterraneensis TaxID=2754695 RepID=A0A838BJP3_9HYPH|nr:hypothetical protein [Microvirga mediterraneensis]MBA1154726.1 hypothetical protein [Microvirga mediterraneensis]
MAGTLASLLTDFSSPAAGAPSGISLLRSVKIASEPSPEPPQPPIVDRQAEIAASIEARVRAEEREIARKELEDVLAAEKIRHLEDMNEQRAIWVEQQAQQLSDQISTAVGRIEGDLSEKVANILRPFLAEAYRQQALAEFKEVLTTLLSGNDARLLNVSGPEDLLVSLQASLGNSGRLIEVTPSEHVEVSATAQDTLAQTQLSAWSARLFQALEG